MVHTKPENQLTSGSIVFINGYSHQCYFLTLLLMYTLTLVMWELLYSTFPV